MRLKKIKLVGFKSFVDATQVDFPSNLVAIVGPNGCGKSNIIDAVRFVLGESASKNLRGGAMDDVIFSGSSQRKAINKASIELIFDNQDGGLGGQYADYSEIAIRREVVREGQSLYFLNGTRCRRRDIRDIFLGTGLGPRSYAIIQQGTVSRLIEAKPEEMRTYLEEAAGISKYRERRRETELRLERTRENVSRVDDICDELQRQIDRLEKQAESAQKYQQWHQEKDHCVLEHHAIYWRSQHQEWQALTAEINQEHAELETFVNAQQARETALKQTQERHRQQRLHVDDQQSTFYQCQTQLTRLTQNLHHLKHRRQQLMVEAEQAQLAEAEARHHLKQDEASQAQLTALSAQLEPQIEREQQHLLVLESELSAIEQAVTQGQQRWESLQQILMQHRQQAETEQAHIRLLETQLQRQQQQITQSERQLQLLSDDLPRAEAQNLQEQLADQSHLQEDLTEQLFDLRERIQDDKQSLMMQQQAIEQLRTRLQFATAEEAALQKQQQTMLQQPDSQHQAALEQFGLSNLPYFFESLQVAPRWHASVEALLHPYLKALCADSTLKQDLSTWAAGALAVVQPLAEVVASDIPSDGLWHQIKADYPPAWLQHIFTAEDLPAALARQAQLASHQSILTPSGFWIGQNWVRCLFESKEAKSAGWLQRREEIVTLGKTIDNLQLQLAEKNQAYQALEQRCQQAQGKYEEVRQQQHQLERNVLERRAKLNALQLQIQQIEHQRQQLEQSLQSHRDHRQQDEAALTTARSKWSEAMAAIERDQPQQIHLQQQRQTQQTELAACKQRCREQAETVRQLVSQRQAHQSQLQSLERSLERSKVQRQQTQDKLAAVQAALEEQEEQCCELEPQIDMETERCEHYQTLIAEGKALLETLESELETAQKDHQWHQQQHLQRHQQLETRRLAAEALRVKFTTRAEQITALNADPSVIASDLPAAAAPEVWQEKIDSLQRKIERLGAINLAAIEEHRQQLERKTYLDQQREDLIAAVSTLTDAIQKIDRETRARFKITFEQVNQGFQTLFPKLFGGGEAALQLEDNDLLSGGVSLTARPPGKRNASVQILSGGEKALTAIALVFAIFQLNPAPFCLLDEVDAPLDDANIHRFCELLQEMSSELQFIFISHNKPAIAVAEQLVGITMQEPGVSRVVAVDVDAALDMAAA